jgi:hypothetical protein
MDLSAFPTRELLRWTLAVRVGLAVLVPIAWQYWRTGEVVGAAMVAALVAALVSLASLGPEMTDPRWIAVAGIGTPVAVLMGVVLGPSPTGGVLWVFLLYVCHGAMVQAGLVSQMAWFPVSTAGLCASVLSTGAVPAGQYVVPAVLGSAWSVLLIIVVPSVIRAPRLRLPAGALHVDSELLRRMVRAPSLRDWLYPALLGGLATLVLVVADAATGGFRPFWAVFALSGVLAPTAAATRRSSWETVASTTAGVMLAGVLLWSGLPALVLLSLTLLLALVGAALMLRNGVASKLLLTPLPVMIAAASLGPDKGLALGMRLAEYLLGAGVGFAAGFAAEWLSKRLEKDRPVEEAELAG